MSRNGAGQYSLPALNPVVTGTTVSSTWANNTLTDIATALTQSIAYDGQTVPIANIPLGGFKLTGLGAATTNGDALRFNEIATQAQQEVGASVATLVSPGRQQFHPSAAKAWCKFNASGTLLAAFNVTSVTDVGVGNWLVTITVAFSSADYVVQATVSAGGGAGRLVYLSTQTTTQSTVLCASDFVGTLADADAIYWAAFGDQA